MTATTPVERIGELLEGAGYRQLPNPLQISGLSFDVPAAYLGTSPSPDLVLVADTELEPGQRILRKVEGIGRALDVMRSRRPVTTVLAGPRPDAEIVDALTKICRVLPVGVSPNGDLESALSNWLAVLLPLRIPEPNQSIADPLHEIAKHLDGLAPSIADLVEIAPAGADIVQSRLHELLNNSLASVEGSDDSA